MTFHEFFREFGGSLRTKHLRKRPVALPETSGLPREFIRLCPWEAEYIWAVAQRATVGIVEIGRLNGGSTFLLACANRDVPIWSIDIAPVNDNLLYSYFEENKLGANVRLVIGDSKTTFPTQADDLVFIDGDHSYDGCMSDLMSYGNVCELRRDFLLHDSYLGSYGVQKAALDFLDSHPEFQSVLSPSIGAEHWKLPAGSVAHLMRR